MKDTFAPLIIIGFAIFCFCTWAYGVAVCWRADEIFWLVVSIFFAPVGFVIGLYNFVL